MLTVVRAIAYGIPGKNNERQQQEPDFFGQFIVLKGESRQVSLNEPVHCFFSPGQILERGTDVYELGEYKGLQRYSCPDHISLVLTEEKLRRQLSGKYGLITIVDVET